MKKGSKLLNCYHFSSITFGEKASDTLSKWAGSWSFIIFFFLFITLWMGSGGYFILNFIGNGEFNDIYPFILLNLILSCLAAIQAPVILMSQNRQSKKDRHKSEYDYSVNRKAKREIEAIQKQLDRIERRLGNVKKKSVKR